MPRAIFKHDQFLGERQGVWHAPGFAVSRLLPTVPEDGVIEHAHAEAHFVLLLDGTYVSSAHGAPCEAREPVLIYNPPGTVHRDRFRGDGGAFMTVAVSLVSQRCCEEVMTLPDYACVVGDGARPMALATAGALARAETVDELALESQCLELMSETALHYRPVQERAPAWLRRARECLREADLPGGLADVARACGVHPVYLARAFRAHYGCSPRGIPAALPAQPGGDHACFQHAGAVRGSPGMRVFRPGAFHACLCRSLRHDARALPTRPSSVLHAGRFSTYKTGTRVRGSLRPGLLCHWWVHDPRERVDA